MGVFHDAIGKALFSQKGRIFDVARRLCDDRSLFVQGGKTLGVERRVP
jgi:hypothetical protein